MLGIRTTVPFFAWLLRAAAVSRGSIPHRVSGRGLAPAAGRAVLASPSVTRGGRRARDCGGLDGAVGQGGGSPASSERPGRRIGWRCGWRPRVRPAGRTACARSSWAAARSTRCASAVTWSVEATAAAHSRGAASRGCDGRATVDGREVEVDAREGRRTLVAVPGASWSRVRPGQQAPAVATVRTSADLPRGVSSQLRRSIRGNGRRRAGRPRRTAIGSRSRFRQRKRGPGPTGHDRGGRRTRARRRSWRRCPAGSSRCSSDLAMRWRRARPSW